MDYIYININCQEIFQISRKLEIYKNVLSIMKTLGYKDDDCLYDCLYLIEYIK